MSFSELKKKAVQNLGRMPSWRHPLARSKYVIAYKIECTSCKCRLSKALMSSGDRRSITFSIFDAITELTCDSLGVCGNTCGPFELSTIYKTTSALIQSCVWIKALSRPVFFATFFVRGGHGIRQCLQGRGDCRNDGR